MTLTPFTVYLIMQADDLRQIVFIITICGLIFIGLILFVSLVGFMAEDDEKVKKMWGRLPMKTTFAVVAALGLLWGSLPSTKTLCAAYVVPAIAQSNFIKKDAPELYDLAIGKLKEQLAPATLEKK